MQKLLSKGANVNDICPKSKYNSLMLAIEGRHRYFSTHKNCASLVDFGLYTSATALTILSDRNQGLSALQYRCGNYKTPMRMLIQHMPGKSGQLHMKLEEIVAILTDLAEWVLNRIELDTSQEDSVHHGRKLAFVGYC